MMAHSLARFQLIRTRIDSIPRHPIADVVVWSRSSKHSETLTMESQSKRPTCLTCSKPLRVCLCRLIQTPCLDNPVSVTILQHSLERNHALNSTRIAKLGLRNVSVTTVFDVDCEAQFIVKDIQSSNDLGFGVNGAERSDCDNGFLDGDPKRQKIEESLNFCQNLAIENSRSEELMRMSMRKHGVISQISHTLKLGTCKKDSNLKHIMASTDAIEVLSKGFMVTKYSEEQAEFELEIPPGSVLLFPSEESISIADLKATGFNPKNLIVLDGTWAKAKRVYLENPWLKILKHVKLDMETESLYGDVRRQPKAGCLSTLESIVYATKEIGNYPNGLENLLDVFESMVQNQRKCKDERLRKVFENQNL